MKSHSSSTSYCGMLNASKGKPILKKSNLKTATCDNLSSCHLPALTAGYKFKAWFYKDLHMCLALHASLIRRATVGMLTCISLCRIRACSFLDHLDSMAQHPNLWKQECVLLGHQWTISGSAI